MLGQPIVSKMQSKPATPSRHQANLSRSTTPANRLRQPCCSAAPRTQAHHEDEASRRTAAVSTSYFKSHQTSSPPARNLVRAASARTPSVNFFNTRAEANYTVIKAQVALFGNIKKFQRAFDRLAGEYDADDDDALHGIMTEAAELIMRNTEYAGYASTAGKAFSMIEDCEAKFQAVSLEERTKYKEETLVNTASRQRRKAFSGRGVLDNGLDEWMCVTLLAAIEGPSRLPKTLESVTDLRRAMSLFAGIGPDDLLAFELIWTPQDEGDSYSRDELLADYPTLHSL